MLRGRKNTHKFDSKSDEKIFLRHSSNNRASRVYNLRTKTIVELIKVVVDDRAVKKMVNR